MLHRSTSSRRRRASRSSGSSPQAPRSPRSAGSSPGRRASIAVSPVDGDRAYRTSLAPEMNRSPRHSIIPDISLNSREPYSPDEMPNMRSPRHSIAPECLSPRGSIAPDVVLSPRNSLIPDGARSPRHSLTPGDYSRSPRNSLVPDGYNRSPRNSLAADSYNRSPRNSLVPDNINKSPRNSLVPDNNTYGSRMSLTPDFNRSPRNSIAPDMNRSPRNSIAPDMSRSPRNSIAPVRCQDYAISDSVNWNEASPDEISSSRHNIDANRSPRGSISDRTSPRGSIGGDYNEKTCLGPDSNHNKSPRGSLVKSSMMADDVRRSPRGSLTLTFQDPPASDVRRYSADNPKGSSGRSSSPYRGTRGTFNMGYNSNSALSEGGSRRASSSVSQVGLQGSGDEQRRLCSDQKKYKDSEQGLGLGIGISLTTYGSVAYQLKDANLEANGTCDFVCKALSIVNKTVVVTVVFVFLSTLPLIMLIMGIQFLRDCPCEPHIPVYMVVGGSVGCIKMAWVLWDQLHTRTVDLGTSNSISIGAKVASFGLTLFLMAWFVLGNYWILRIKWPDYSPTLFEPNRWCHRTLYVFSIVHLYIMYSLISALVLLIIALAGCQLFGCLWIGVPGYK